MHSYHNGCLFMIITDFIFKIIQATSNNFDYLKVPVVPDYYNALVIGFVRYYLYSIVFILHFIVLHYLV